MNCIYNKTIYTKYNIMYPFVSSLTPDVDVFNCKTILVF